MIHYRKKFSVLFFFLFVVSLILFVESCKPDPIDKVYSPTAFNVEVPTYFPPYPVNANNELTVEGIALGKRLFYDKILSGDNTQSCASCHQQAANFVDKEVRFSEGIDGSLGKRNAMTLSNLAYSKAFFWDGRAASIEEQVLMPIQDPSEMHETLVNAVSELQNHEQYPDLFFDAFGTNTVSEENLSKALAQFVRSIISYSFKLAPGGTGRAYRDAQQERGFMVYLDEEKGDCFHCHTVTLMNTDFRFVNNGVNDGNATDLGLFGVTANENDKHKFKTPTLLNIKYTAPYMHDGRFNSLEEVIDFYDTGFHVTPSLDPNIRKHADQNGKPIPRLWSEQDKKDLIYFLESLVDEDLLVDPAYAP
jgi:cytochrome c peroxidase